MHNLATQRRERLMRGFTPQTAAAASPHSQARPADLDIADIRHFPVREPVSGTCYSLLRHYTIGTYRMG